MREWESEPDLDIYGDGDHEDEKESSDTDTEVRSWTRHASLPAAMPTYASRRLACGLITYCADVNGAGG